MMRAPYFSLCAALVALPAAAAAPQSLRVTVLESAPTVDGNLADWGKDGWHTLKVAPAVKAEERARLGLSANDYNAVGNSEVRIKLGAHGGKLYVAARWADDEASLDYKGWAWQNGRYVEGKKRDDMFAIRFHADGDFDRSMLSAKSYRVDLWLWSAGRSNQVGLAEDMQHTISTREIESAAEYQVAEVGTVYIKKQRDEGGALVKLVRPPKEKTQDSLPSIEVLPKPNGSSADVAAKGVWKSGSWHLEMARALNTGNADDVSFAAGQKLTAQIAVFNHSGDENKSVSEPFLLDFATLK